MLNVEFQAYSRVLWGMKWAATHIITAAALALLAGCSGSAGMAPLPHYANHLTLLPSSRFQIRTIQFRPDRAQCWAFAQVQSDLRNIRCYDVITLQLGPLHPDTGSRTGFAAIRQRVARMTPNQLDEGCMRTLRKCRIKSGLCIPGWTAQTSLQFDTNSRQVGKGWITCGMGIFNTFRYHVHWCDAIHGLPPFQRQWLSAGDDFKLTIPGVVQDDTEERISIRPNGALVFQGLP